MFRFLALNEVILFTHHSLCFMKQLVLLNGQVFKQQIENVVVILIGTGSQTAIHDLAVQCQIRNCCLYISISNSNTSELIPCSFKFFKTFVDLVDIVLVTSIALLLSFDDISN